MKKTAPLSGQYHRFRAISNGDLFFVKSLDRLTVSKNAEHIKARFPGHDDFVKISSPFNKLLYVCCGKAILVVPVENTPKEGKERKCKSYEAS